MGVPTQFYHAPPGTVVARTMMYCRLMIHTGIKVDDNNVIDFDQHTDNYGCHVHLRSPQAFFRGLDWQGRKYEWFNHKGRTLRRALHMLWLARRGISNPTYHPILRSCVQFTLMCVLGWPPHHMDFDVVWHYIWTFVRNDK